MPKLSTPDAVAALITSGQRAVVTRTDGRVFTGTLVQTDAGVKVLSGQRGRPAVIALNAITGVTRA